MPWHIESDNPDCSGFAVVKDADGDVEGCHQTKADAQKQLAALYANEEAAMPDDPRIEIREASAGPTVRDVDGKPRIVGHFARFNSFNEINSTEGQFLERITPGAFKKTLAENRRIRMLFQHGRDPQIGEQPIGKPQVLREDDIGPYFEAELFGAVPPLIVEGLREGEYGVSYRFSVVNEDWNHTPTRSDYNPKRLPERTIREARVYEFGPVTFPADHGADYAVRAVTLSDLDAASAPPEQAEALPADEAAAEPHLDEGSREAVVPVAPKPEESPPVEYVTIDEKRARDREITDELTRTANEFTGVLPADEQVRWDKLTSEQDALRADIAAYEARMARLEFAAQRAANAVPVAYQPVPAIVRKTESDIYDPAIQQQHRYRSVEEWSGAQRDNAMRAAEQAVFPQNNVNQDEARDGVQRMLDSIDTTDRQLARRLLATGSPVYRRAFSKLAAGLPLSPEEVRGTSMVVTTDANGGYAVPFAWDPTWIHTGAWTYVNGIRANATVKQIVGTDTWRGVSVGAVTATRGAESTEQAEQGPTLAQPEILATRVSAFVSYSIEMGQDRPDIGAELASLIAEAKDTEEESTFTTSASGTIGIMPAHGTAGAYTHINLATDHTLTAADAYAVEAALPLRHRRNAIWFMGRAMIRAWQALETTGGQLFGGTNYASVGYPANSAVGATGLFLLRYPIVEAPSAETAYAGAGDDLHVITLLADLRASYYIIDRIGMSVEFVPHLFHADGKLPIGVRGLYAMWRNAAEPVNTDGGRLLVSTAA